MQKSPRYTGRMPGKVGAFCFAVAQVRSRSPPAVEKWANGGNRRGKESGLSSAFGAVFMGLWFSIYGALVRGGEQKRGDDLVQIVAPFLFAGGLPEPAVKSPA